MYLNNAATTVTKPEAYYSAPVATMEKTQEALMKFFQCKNQEKIFLTKGGSEALRAALYGFIAQGDHVITTDMEYGTVLDTLQELETKGCNISYIPTNKYGTLRYELIEEAITPQTKVIVCCHGSNVTGNITDIEKVGAIARRHKLLLIVDGCQTVGATPISFNDLGADVFCFTGHKKLMGPYGTGGIILRQDLELPREIEKSLSKPSPEDMGKLCASIKFIEEKGIYGITIFPHRLAKRFFEAVKSMKDVTVYGDFGTSIRIPTVSISVKGHTAEEVKAFMRKRHIAVKAGDFNAPRMIKALGKDGEGLVRFSFGYFNTRQEVNEAIWALMMLLDLDDLYLLS